MAYVSEPLAEKRFVPSLDPPSASAEAKAVLPGGILHQQARPEFATQLQSRAAKSAECLVSSPRPRVPASPRPQEGVPASPRREEVAASSRRQKGGEYHIRLAGEGGQGIVLAGLLLAEAAVAAGKNATHAQAYGPESRGGASKAEVIVSDGDIDYPYADRVDLLLALTQEAYEQYVPQLKENGILVVDSARVTPATPNGVTCHALPITATAQRLLGTTVGANLVALGALVGLSRIVLAEASEQAVAARKPGGDAARAVTALRAGFSLARTVAGTA
jgi:2-oxoglutarate ferredoxin oxidoreductase subunit gamma